MNTEPIYTGKVTNYYDCSVCQKQHFQAEPIYQKHIMFQSKHGTRQILMRDLLQEAAITKAGDHEG